MPLVHDAGITAEGQGVTLKEAGESLGGQLELHALDLDQLALGRFLRDNPTQFLVILFFQQMNCGGFCTLTVYSHWKLLG